jgi:hypothetical protein
MNYHHLKLFLMLDFFCFLYCFSIN